MISCRHGLFDERRNMCPIDPFDPPDPRELAETFLERNKAWIERQLGCAYGLSGPAEKGVAPRIALRFREITPDVAAKIEEFRLKAAGEGLELDVREIGTVTAR